MCNTRCGEPSLNELFHDVAIQLLMRRDGVTENNVRALLDELRDARGVGSGGTIPRARPALGADHVAVPEKNMASNRSTDASNARRFPIRFI